MNTQRITLSIGLVLIAALLMPAESPALELLAARNETGADRAFQHLADADSLTMAESLNVNSFERSGESIEVLPPQPEDWSLQESNLLESQLDAEEEKTGEAALGLRPDTDAIDPSMIFADAEAQASISPEYLAGFILVVGLLVGSKLGLWRIFNQYCFVLAARSQGMSVNTRRQHRRRERSQRNRRASWYFRSARPSRRRTRRHSSGRSSGPSAWRPQNNPGPSHRRGRSTREYVVSDVVFTTNGPVSRASQRVTPPLITLQS